MAVEGISVTSGKLIGEVRVSGVVEGASEAYVVAETGGIIAKVNVKLGDYVSSGQALAVLADKGEGFVLEQVAAQLENAEREYSASERLFEKGAASEADFTRAKSALKGAEAAYKRALDANKTRVLSSPISGYIADLDPAVAMGNLLNPGTRVARVVDLSALKMRASLGERQIGLVSVGSSAEIRFNSFGELEPISAFVTAIAAGSDPTTGAYRLVIEGPNRSDVTKSGMTATAVIGTNEKPELIIPASAVVTRGGVSGAFVYRDGAAYFTPVETGTRYGDSIAVESGVVEGDVLLVSGTTTLVNGDVVVVTLLGRDEAVR
jgi:membrane fusion protein (multidrug efflux system)